MRDTVVKKGHLIVVSGASGTGKTTLCRSLEKDLEIYFSISATTRQKREGEVEGKDYYFLSENQFGRMAEKGEFLEWAQVHGHRYGTIKRQVVDRLEKGENVLLDVDSQGALNIKNKLKDAVLIFIKTPTLTELRTRLFGRGTDSSEEIEKRIQKASEEIAQSKRYDYVLVNNNLEDAKKELKKIVQKVIN